MATHCKVFFFQSAHGHGELHSFPTRRSSDLMTKLHSQEGGLDRVEPAVESRHVVEVLLRSEEHTSELQSRLHLVCRLLLEKKKKTSPQPTPPTSTDSSRNH